MEKWMEFKLVPVRPGRIKGAVAFLVLKDGQLVFGLFGGHQGLWFEYCRQNRLAEETQPDLFAAGVLYPFDGQIATWGSGTFSFTTPAENRDSIEEFARKHVELFQEMFREIP